MKLWISLCLLIISLPLRAQSGNTELHRLFAEYYEDLLRDSPELATVVGRRDYNDRWTDYSPEALRRRLEKQKEYLARLQTFNAASLNEHDRLSYDILERQLLRNIEGFDFNVWYTAVSQMNGPHLGVFSTIPKAPAQTVKDYEDLLARLNALPRLSDQLADLAGQALEKKLVQPRLVADAVVRQLENQMTADASISPLTAPFRKFPDGIPAAEQKRLRAAALRTYKTDFQPAWKKLRDYIAKTYVPQARETIALSKIPGGPEMYAFLVKRETTTGYTPQQIHDIGLREVQRIKKEMASIRKALDFEGTRQEFVANVLEAPQMLFESEDEILMHGRDIAKRIDPELPKLFRKLPRMPYGVRAIPPDRARTAAPYYEGPSLDGTRAGYFYLRTFQPETQSKCCLEALIIHEAVPGHHLQIALASEMQDVPEFRKLARFTAYQEGWALYAETLGPDLGMYQSPYEVYGKLQNEILRAVRLVVDTGIHSLGWPREKAIEMMRLAKGGFITESFISSEVDRYIAWPAQALAYKIGGLKIEELRRTAQKELGSKFDVRQFHDVVLRSGALPLDVLEQQVHNYITAAKQGS